jgi:hypothetical protein
MSLLRLLAAPVVLALAGAAQVAAQTAPLLVIPDAEVSDPPTHARLEEIEAQAASTGWLSVALPLRAAAVGAYGRGRLAAADAWFHAFQWTAIFSEPEDRYLAGWVDAMRASQLNYPGVSGEYPPANRPIGSYLSPAMQDWVLSNQAFSEEFFSLVRPVDKLPTVFGILEGLHRRDPARFARYASLALAIAVVYDVPPPPWWPHLQVSEDALPRKLPNPAAPFDWFTHEDILGRTYHGLARLRAEELKFVIDAAAPLPELVWAQQAVPFSLDGFEGAYQMIHYRTDRTTSQEVMVWSGRPYTLPAIYEEGGICIDQAYFASEAGKARGIPTLLFNGAGQDGHHAWFGFLDAENRWRLDAGRYAEQRLVTGIAIDPQTWCVISDHELQFLSERFRALPSYKQSMIHEEFANDFLLSGHPALAIKAARTAVNYERRNMPAWETLLAASAKTGADAATQEGIMREAALAFAHYPDVFKAYKNRISESLRARGETSLANFEERSVAEALKGDRADLAVQQAAGILARSIATQSVVEQIASYNAILSQFGHDAGTGFFEEIVVGFAEHLAELHMNARAREAVERAREVLEVQPGTQFAGEIDQLMAKLQK